MYDKLGDLLNDVLESGKIPEYKEEHQKPYNQKDDVASDFSFNHKDTPPVSQERPFAPPPHIIPASIKKALAVLNLLKLEKWSVIKKAYHTALKNTHPDTSKTKTEYTVEQVIKAFSDLKEYYKKNKKESFIQNL